MLGRALATFLGFVGGALVALAGFVTFLGGLLRTGVGTGSAELASSLVLGFVAIVLGVVMVIVSRPRLLWWRGRSLTTGVLLIVLAVATWVIIGGGLLMVLGVLLAVIAGLIFVVEEFTHRSLFSRLGFGRRRIF